MHLEQIQQVTLFKKSGNCILNLDYRGTGLSEDLFSGLLSAIDSFSQECLGLELCELATTNSRVFLNRIDDLILAVVTEGSDHTYLDLRPRVLSFMDRFGRVLSTVDTWSSQAYPQEDLEVLVWLREMVEEELARAFSIGWMGISFDEAFLLDIGGIRILTHLSDQQTHTRYGINKKLGLSRSLIDTKLCKFAEEGFVMIEEVTSGKNVVKRYVISELGKLVLDNLETKFPGLWFQSYKG
jgi:hypothetical protein